MEDSEVVMQAVRNDNKLTLPMIMKKLPSGGLGGSKLVTSWTSANATYMDKLPLHQTVGPTAKRGYHSVNRSQIFTEKALAKSSLNQSMLLERFNRSVDT